MANGSGPGLPTLAALAGVSVLAVVGLYASDVVPRREGGPATISLPDWQPGTAPQQARALPSYDRGGEPPPEPSSPPPQQSAPGSTGQPPPQQPSDQYQRGPQGNTQPNYPPGYPPAPSNGPPGGANAPPGAPGDGQPQQ